MSIKKHLLLTKTVISAIISTAGKTEAGSAGEQPARDNRPGYGELPSGSLKNSPPTLYRNGENSLFPPCLKKRNVGISKIVTKTYERYFHFRLNQYNTA